MWLFSINSSTTVVATAAHPMNPNANAHNATSRRCAIRRGGAVDLRTLDTDGLRSASGFSIRTIVGSAVPLPAGPAARDARRRTVCEDGEGVELITSALGPASDQPNSLVGACWPRPARTRRSRRRGRQRLRCFCRRYRTRDRWLEADSRRQAAGRPGSAAAGDPVPDPVAAPPGYRVPATVDPAAAVDWPAGATRSDTEPAGSRPSPAAAARCRWVEGYTATVGSAQGPVRAALPAGEHLAQPDSPDLGLRPAGCRGTCWAARCFAGQLPVCPLAPAARATGCYPPGRNRGGRGKAEWSARVCPGTPGMGSSWRHALPSDRFVPLCNTCRSVDHAVWCPQVY